MLEGELIENLIKNVSVVVVLGYWVLSERKSHRETLDYYREMVTDLLEEIEAKMNSISENISQQ